MLQGERGEGVKNGRKGLEGLELEVEACMIWKVGNWVYSGLCKVAVICGRYIGG